MFWLVITLFELFKELIELYLAVSYMLPPDWYWPWFGLMFTNFCFEDLFAFFSKFVFSYERLLDSSCWMLKLLCWSFELIFTYDGWLGTPMVLFVGWPMCCKFPWYSKFLEAFCFLLAFCCWILSPPWFPEPLDMMDLWLTWSYEFCY